MHDHRDLPNRLPNRRQSTNLHPLIYGSFVAAVLWLLAASWAFDGVGRQGGGYAGLALAVVTGFSLIAVGLPLVLWRIWARHRLHRPGEQPLLFRDWLDGQLAIWQGRLGAGDATLLALLPIAAVVVGMTALAIVLHFTI